MKTVTIVAALAAAGLSSAVYAQRGPDPWGDATVARTEEQAKADERFAALDTDKDGVLSADEQKAVQNERGPGGPRGLRRADGNGDGKITKDEFIAAQLERFDRQDADKDGKLTKAERDAARARFQQRGGGDRDRSGGGGFESGGFGGGGFGDD